MRGKGRSIGDVCRGESTTFMFGIVFMFDMTMHTLRTTPASMLACSLFISLSTALMLV